MSVRRVVGRRPDGRPLFGDVVGDLVRLDASVAVIETRDGAVELPLEVVSIARIAPPSTADELAVEAVAADGLRPLETDALGGWRLRADHGFLRRANSVLPLGQPGMPLDDALAAVRDWYAARELPARFHLPVEGRRLLDAGLGERGWPVDVEAAVLVRRLDGTTQAPPEVEITDRPDDDWLALYRGGQGSAPGAVDLLTRHDTVGFAALRRDGRTVAVGRGVVDSGWLGVMAIEVDPSYRRQGLAGLVMAALTAWGRAHGAARSYLQVETDNVAALALYGNLGYWTHHEYRYRTEPQQG